MAFVVPEKFLRNAPNVLQLGPPADIGLSLVDYMCRRIGIADLRGLDMLDFGCGTRFADMLMNRNVPLRSYTGIDVHGEMIGFLRREATDPRLSFHRFDARNPVYSPNGTPMRADTRLPIDDQRFDLICLLSVITHQLPEDAGVLFAILRRHIRPGGHMFFSAYVDDESGVDYYEDRPDTPAGLSRFSTACLTRLLAQAGWRVLSSAPPNPDDLPILDSFLCASVGAD
jgi:SAM-dependent methyltransferase